MARTETTARQCYDLFRAYEAFCQVGAASVPIEMFRSLEQVLENMGSLVNETYGRLSPEQSEQYLILVDVSPLALTTADLVNRVIETDDE